jgi:hypothetical protein
LDWREGWAFVVENPLFGLDSGDIGWDARDIG